MRRLLALLPVLLLVGVIGFTLTAANTVPDHDRDDDVRAQGINDVKPPECEITTQAARIISNAAVVTGTAAAEVILGGDAAQTIDGGGGDDCIHGGGGNDTILGGTGTDVVIGGPGTDTCTAEHTYQCS